MSLRIAATFPNTVSTGFPRHPEAEVYFVTPPLAGEGAIQVPGDNVEQSQALLQWLLENPEQHIPEDLVVAHSTFRELSFVRDRYLQDVQAIAEEWIAAGSPMDGVEAEKLANKLSDARVLARQTARARSRIPSIAWDVVDGAREFSRTGSLSEAAISIKTGKSSTVRNALRAGEFGRVSESAGKANVRLGPATVSVAKRIQPWLAKSAKVLVAVDLGYQFYRVITAEGQEQQLKALGHLGVSATTAVAAALCVATPIAGPAGVAACFFLPIAAGIWLDYKIDTTDLARPLPLP